MEMCIVIGIMIFLGWGFYQTLHCRNLRFYIKPSLEQFYIDITPLLDVKGVRYFLDYGTLLGYYRSQSFIDYEFDVDMAVHVDFKDRVLEVVTNLPDGYYIRTPAKGDFSRWKQTNIKIKHRKRLGSFDIYFYYPFEGDWVCQAKACRFVDGRVVSCKTTSDYSQLPLNWFFPLKESVLIVKGEARTCYVPNQIENYIAHLYGSRNPKPDMKGLFCNRLFIKRFWSKC